MHALKVPSELGRAGNGIKNEEARSLSTTQHLDKTQETYKPARRFPAKISTEDYTNEKSMCVNQRQSRKRSLRALVIMKKFDIDVAKATGI